MKNLFYVMLFQVFVGVWLVISPFVLGYREITAMTANDVVFGAVVLILGIVGAFVSVPDLRHAEKKMS
jgi:SPW repeat